MLTTGKLGFWGLTALVFGLMVGVGIYTLPQNMSASASPLAVMLSWLITGAGILPLVISFNYLSNKFPQYNAGLYQYAQAGFGNFTGFNIAWGYWLCTAFSNVAFGVMLNDSFGAFYPPLLNHGWPTVAFCSSLIWLMFWIVSRGINLAKAINSALALIKVVMLVFIVTVFIIYFRIDQFEADTSFHGQTDLLEQIRNTMLITLFCFFGVEGAVMMSARAIKSSDVGKAGFAGFFIALLLYMAVSMLCFGLMSRGQLAGLPNPSIAYILKDIIGDWAYWFVISAVIISLLGGWVAWTLIVAQVPYEASVVGIMPRCFSRLNKHGMPTFGLKASSITMNLFLLMVVMADDVYLAALRITGLMIIPCYFYTGLFLLKRGQGIRIKTIASIATLFCIWMAYAGGLMDMVMTSVFYLAGIMFFVKAQKEKGNLPIFTGGAKWTIALFCLGGIITIYWLAINFEF